MAVIGGRVFLSINGQRVALRGDITSNIGQRATREAVLGLDNVHGFTDKPVVPFIQCTLSELPSFTLADLNAVTNATITAELADGRVLMLRNAWNAGDPERNPEEGALNSVRFEGESGEEQGA